MTIVSRILISLFLVGQLFALAHAQSNDDKLPIDQTGALVVSLSAATLRGGPAINASKEILFIRNRKTGESREVKSRFENQEEKTASADGVGSGAVIVMRLLPGEYEVFSFSVFRSGRGTFIFPSVYRAEEEFSIPFTIKRSEVTYLGRYSSRAEMGTGAARHHFKRFHFVVTEQTERDMEMAKMRHPELASLPVQLVLPDFDKVNPLMIKAGDRTVCDTDGCRIEKIGKRDVAAAAAQSEKSENTAAEVK